ncbi:MAG: hypothetical protein JO225_01335 [Candidatus Eremiobacteraeota bacterium]|nr:hypothetical protein [Candidatus Eremiobacteraeota bacterium]
MIRTLSRAAVGALFAGALTACSGGGASTPAVTSVNPVTSAKLQFAVGTARFVQGAQSFVGLNTVETLRQSNGLSGLVFDVPTITGPPAFALSTPLVGDGVVFANTVGADDGTNRITLASLTTSTGAFGYGFCECNSNVTTSSGTSASYATYVAFQEPLFGGQTSGVSAAQALVDPHAYNATQPAALTTGQGELVPYGGPPAFPTTRDGTFNAAFLGYSLGFTIVDVAPVAGTYRLDVAIPSNANAPVTASTPTLSASGTLTTVAGLPIYPTPTITFDGNGGASIGINPPSGVTETMVVAVGGGCIVGQAASYYTIFTSTSGPQQLVLPDALGPTVNGSATPSVCLNHGKLTAVAIGFDYPAYEAAYPMSTAQTPPITGGNGQADLTISAVTSATAP